MTKNMVKEFIRSLTVHCTMEVGDMENNMGKVCSLTDLGKQEKDNGKMVKGQHGLTKTLTANQTQTLILRMSSMAKEVSTVKVRLTQSQGVEDHQFICTILYYNFIFYINLSF